MQGDAATKDVLMRTAGPTELTAGLTVLTCLLIDHLTQFQPGAVLAIATQMRDNSVDMHREDSAFRSDSASPHPAFIATSSAGPAALEQPTGASTKVGRTR